MNTTYLGLGFRSEQVNDWVLGAANFDEDLHFSYCYLYASSVAGSERLYPGYSRIVAFYDEFVERYYLPRSECEAAAEAIIERAIREPEWFPGVLKRIRAETGLLSHVFAGIRSRRDIATLNNADLIHLYNKHLRRMRSFYRFARVPEALDRGTGTFSRHLRAWIERHSDLSMSVDDVWDALTAPGSLSVFAREMVAFDRIVDEVRREREVASLIVARPKLARLALPSRTMEQLRSHCRKWKYLGYHGYSGRAALGLDSLIRRLSESLRREGGRSIRLLAALRSARERRVQVLEALSADRTYVRLFGAYRSVRAVKAFRRYAQLRYFLYLDMLVDETARRLAVDEWTVRCMLPEEVLDCLRIGRVVVDDIEARKDFCALVFYDGGARVISGSEARALRSEVEGAAAASTNTGSTIRGSVACPGRAEGRCRIVIRASDASSRFCDGDILVSESTDPDLLGLIERAGAVLTEQGGVTAHAALVCRELGVPAVVGIPQLLSRVSDGQRLVVDANRGIVEAVDHESVCAEVDISSVAEARIIGHKAWNLGRLRSMGGAVPEYIVLSYGRLASLINEHADLAAVSNAARERLAVRSDGHLAIRSSCIGEDSGAVSRAGQFQSLLNVPPESLEEALREFVVLNERSRGRHEYRGGVIVQQMVSAEWAGVCVVGDVRIRNGECTVIEYKEGSNHEITSGVVTPQRVMIDCRTGDICESAGVHAERGGPDINCIARQAEDVARAVGYAVNIEWAYRDGKLFLLQMRPVVSS